MSVKYNQSIARRFLVYFEGVKVRFAHANISSNVGGFLTASVVVPFDKGKKIRKIRPKTLCHIFFVEDTVDGTLRLLFEGELMSKEYSVTPTGPSAAFMFQGVSANLIASRFALIGSSAGAPQPNNNMASANTATQYALRGDSISASTGEQTDESLTSYGYFSAPINRDLIAKTFVDEIKGGGDMTKAFRSMLNQFTYGSSGPSGNGLTVQGLGATTQLAVSDKRFHLFESLQGATSKELVSIFYGLQDETSGKANPFLAAILNTSTGEDSIYAVMQRIAQRAYHIMSEIAAPPPGTSTSGTVVPRLILTPNLYHADPPVCNLFFPHMTGAIKHGITCQKTTRLIASQMLPNTAGAPLSVIGVSPRELATKLVDSPGAGAPDNRIRLAHGITQEESEVGLYALSVDSIYGSPWNLTSDQLLTWFDKTNELRFYANRSDEQGAAIRMEFNPFPVVGFPGAFVDPFIGVGRGLVGSVHHSITPTSGTTMVAMTNCFFGDDDMENQSHPSVEDGFGGRINIYANAGANDVYQSLLGVDSVSTRESGSSSPLAAEQGPAITVLPEIDTGGSSLNDIIRGIFDRVTDSQDPIFARRQVYDIVRREIASINDLYAFYKTGALNEAPGTPLGPGVTVLPEIDTTTVTAALNTAEEAALREPNVLPFSGPFLGAQFGTKVTFTDSSSTTTQDYVVPPGSTPGIMQVADRIQPVKDYVNSLGD